MKTQDGTEIKLGHVFQSKLWLHDGKKVICIAVGDNFITLRGESEDEVPFTLSQELFNSSQWVITDYRKLIVKEKEE